MIATDFQTDKIINVVGAITTKFLCCRSLFFFFVCYGLGSIFVRAGAAHCYAVMPRVLIVFILLLKSAI